MAVVDQSTATRIEMPAKARLHRFDPRRSFTGLAVGWLGLVPEVQPDVALTLLVAVVLVCRHIAISLATAIVFGPPYGLWRLATRARRRRSTQAKFSPTRPVAWDGG
jgi:hypothetical protein